MTDYECPDCGFVGHKGEWRTFRGHERYECPECGTGLDEAAEVQ